VLFLDALVVNVKHDGHVEKKSIYLALAIRMDGHKELLGLWIDQHEGAKFWLGILNELVNRGVKDILIAAVDGLTGFPEAINAVFPRTEVQLCMVHMVRSSLKYVPLDSTSKCNDLFNKRESRDTPCTLILPRKGIHR
jgi:transposase-like protein